MRIVPALDRGLAVLELLSTRREPMRVTDIAGELGIPRSATYEIVHTLRERNYVRVDTVGLVALGPQLFVLGSSYSAQLDIGTAAQHAATTVMRRINETVQVGVLDGREVLYIARADSNQMVRLVSAVGRRLPAHCTGIGKVLLSELDAAALDERLRGVELERFTPQSITDRDQLAAVLEDIRQTGIGEDDRESNPEVCCVAAPVRDITGSCVAAISISVPTARMDRASRPRLVEAVRTGAAELSATLGFGTPAAAAPTTLQGVRP